MRRTIDDKLYDLAQSRPDEVFQVYFTERGGRTYGNPLQNLKNARWRDWNRYRIVKASRGSYEAYWAVKKGIRV